MLENVSKRPLVFVVWLAGCLGGASVLAGEPPTLDIGSRRELFVDHYLIERLDGTRLKLHEPRPAEVAIKIDRLWEGEFNFGSAVLADGDSYRIYYRGMRPDGQAHSCCAQSKDGIHWTKPDLGLVELDGSRQNNLIGSEDGGPAHVSPFFDTKPGVPASERFKGVSTDFNSKRMYVWTSPDGFKWRKLHEEHVFVSKLPTAFDTYNLAFWSEAESCYVFLFRAWSDGIRSIGRTSSKDLLHWTEESFVTYGDKNVVTPPEHLYTPATEPYFRAPHIHVAFPARFMQGRRVLTDAQVKDLQIVQLEEKHRYYLDCSDGAFMTSRGGPHFDRTFMSVFVRPGMGLENWVSRTNYPLQGVVPTGPAEMSIYVNRHYAQKSWHIQRCTLRIDGFASVNAPYEGGQLVTKPLKFRGRELEINFATSSAGDIRVEIQEADGTPIPGYTLAECPEIIGDEIARIVDWDGGSDVSNLAGRKVRLRLVMKDADLYSFRFRP